MCRKCAAKRRNRRGNILLLCPKVRQGAAAHWKEPNTRIERGERALGRTAAGGPRGLGGRRRRRTSSFVVLRAG